LAATVLINDYIFIDLSSVGVLETISLSSTTVWHVLGFETQVPGRWRLISSWTLLQFTGSITVTSHYTIKP